MTPKAFFEKHFKMYTSQNRPNIPERFSYGKISIWHRTIVGWVIHTLLNER